MYGLTNVEWLLVAAVILLALYYLGTYNHNYFAKRGIHFLRPLPFFGSSLPIVLKQKAITYFTQDLYKQTQGHKCVGMFEFHQPVLIISDPELIKQVTVKDFDHFLNHRDLFFKDDPYFGKSLFVLSGDLWKKMRATLSPTFTTSKMKNMFVLMNACGTQVVKYIEEEIRKDSQGKMCCLDMKDLFTRYTNDVIATSAFGIQTDSLKGKDNEFYMMGKRLTNISSIRSYLFIVFSLFPSLVKIFNASIIPRSAGTFFQSLLHETISIRDQKGIVRADMLQLMMEARRGQLKADAGEDEQLKEHKKCLTETDIVSQCIAFFFAGFETTSSLMCFASNLMAIHEDIQKRLQQEIDEVLGEDGDITYDKVQKMKYMDMVLSETQRMYPQIPSLDRQCVKDFTIPASDGEPEITIKQGEGIVIPIYGLHMDPKYFPDPEKFDPERFSDVNKHKIQQYTYMPFGIGPRLCLGQRFAVLETKVVLAHILRNFQLHVIPQTAVQLTISKKTFAMTVDGGFWVGLSQRRQSNT